MGHSSHQTSLERSSGQPRQANEHSELFSCREILRNPESGRIPQTEREVSQVVLMTVSILETVAQKCVEGRFRKSGSKRTLFQMLQVGTKSGTKSALSRQKRP